MKALTAVEIAHAIRTAHARRRGLKFATIARLGPGDGSNPGVPVCIAQVTVWSELLPEGARTLLAEHGPCVVCGRQTRWGAVPRSLMVWPMGWRPPRYCSRACLRTRPLGDIGP